MLVISLEGKSCWVWKMTYSRVPSMARVHCTMELGPCEFVFGKTRIEPNVDLMPRQYSKRRLDYVRQRASSLRGKAAWG